MNAFGITLLIIGVIIVVFAAINLIIVVKQQRELLLTFILLYFYSRIIIYLLTFTNNLPLHVTIMYYTFTAIDNFSNICFNWYAHSCCGLESSIGDFFNSEWFDVNNAKYHFPSACCPREIRALYNYPHCPTISRYSEVRLFEYSNFAMSNAH
uniref:Tetraspanin n=1 Tax=Syphacia muris TaxID=451379 RepID=A0A0N5AN35_9BILA